MADNPKYIFLLFPVVGIGLFSGGVIYRRKLKKKIVGCERTSGSVIDNIREFNNSTKGAVFAYFPVVEYVVGNERYKVKGDVGSNPAKPIGTKMTVLFRPTNHAEAYIEKDYYMAANIMLAIGSGFMMLGSIFVYAAFRHD